MRAAHSGLASAGLPPLEPKQPQDLRGGMASFLMWELASCGTGWVVFWVVSPLRRSATDQVGSGGGAVRRRAMASFGTRRNAQECRAQAGYNVEVGR